MPEKLRFIVDRAGFRLDKYIPQRYKELTRSYVQRLIKEGRVKVNNCTAKASSKLNAGDKVIINLPPPSPPSLSPEIIPLTVVYEDDSLIVIDKPAGLPVHPAPGHPSHTLVNALLAHCPDLPGINGSLRPGIVHRLDKDTSGLMVVAKKSATQLNLSQQLKSRSMNKRYLVLVRGHLLPQQGTIEAPIARHKRDRKRMAVTYEGREACTYYRVVRYLGDYTLVEATLKTGRTHQIRVHFSAIGFPVVGDGVYGVRSPFLARQFIHACTLGFTLPSTGEYVEFNSELPADLKQMLERIDLT